MCIAKSKIINFLGQEYYKIHRIILPFKYEGKWYFFKKIKTTYLICESGSLPIKTEIVK